MSIVINFDSTNLGACDNWWYDTYYAWSLFNLGERNKNFHDLMVKIFAEGWTRGEELFLGALQCNATGNTGRLYIDSLAGDDNAHDLHDGPGWYGQLYIYPHGLYSTCSSNIRVCVWNDAHDPYAKDGGELVS